jgi:hypothetical protein
MLIEVPSFGIIPSRVNTWDAESLKFGFDPGMGLCWPIPKKFFTDFIPPPLGVTATCVIPPVLGSYPLG